MTAKKKYLRRAEVNGHKHLKSGFKKKEQTKIIKI